MITFSTVKIQKFKIQKCTLFKKICKTIFSLYLENEKRYRKRISGFEIHEKRTCCGKNLSKLIFSGNERTKSLPVYPALSLFISLYFSISLFSVSANLSNSVYKLCITYPIVLPIKLSLSISPKTISQSVQQSLYLCQSLFLSNNLSISLLISPSLSQPLFLSTNLTFSLSISLSLHQSLFLSINISIFKSISCSLNQSFFLSVNLSISLLI